MRRGKLQLPPSAATRLKTKANAEPILVATPPPRARTQTKRSSSARKQASRIARASERKAEAAAEDEAFIAAAAEVEPVQLFRGSKAEATPETRSKSAAVQTQTRKLKELRLPANLALDRPTVQRGLETQENSSREYCKTCKDRESAAANVKRASASANRQAVAATSTGSKASAAKRTSKKRGQRRQRWHHGIIVLISGSEKDGLDEKDAA